MASLTEISVNARKYLIWGLAAVVAFFLLRMLVIFSIDFWKATHQPPPPPPNVRFGVLPQPKFTVIANSPPGMTFELRNIEGRPPEATNSARVFTIPKRSLGLLTEEKGKKFAEKLGFNKEPKIISSTLYHFTDPLTPERTLLLDNVNMNFQLKYDFSQKANELFINQPKINKDQASAAVDDYIDGYGLFDTEIRNGKKEITLLVYDGMTKTLEETKSPNNAMAVRINYYKPDVDGLRVVPPGFRKSHIYVLFANTSMPKLRVLEVVYTYWPVAYDDFGTYPLRTSQQAWQDLLDGYGTIIEMGSNNPNSIVVRSIYLAYYDSEDPQDFFQPIFVFEGDGDFVAYVPAVSPEWLE